MTQPFYVPFRFGIDLITPATQLDPGAALLAVNYEVPIDGGYQSVMGYTKIGDTLPGQGDVLGVAVWKGDRYAMRETAGGGATALYKWDGSTWNVITSTLPLGRYEFASGNLFASAAQERLYFVTSAGKPYKYDGSTVTELTGATAGATWIITHRNHLFIGFTSGSVQFSAIGDDSDWTTANGAGEIGTGDTLNGFASAAGGALMFGGQDSLKALFGTSAANFEVRDIALNSGAKAYSVASLSSPFFLNERGPSTLETVEQFGDFTESNIGRQIQPLMTEGFTPVARCISRERSQYRVWRADGQGIRITMSAGRLVGVTLTQYPDPPVVAAQGEGTSGEEILLFGDAEGNVYEMDDGTSFAGADIESFLTTAYNHCRSPTLRKRFRRAYIESTGLDETDFFVLPSFGYGVDDIARHLKETISFIATGGQWNISTWNNFSWSGPYQSDTPISLSGTATNIGFSFYHTSSTKRPHSIKGYTVHYQERRLARG